MISLLEGWTIEVTGSPDGPSWLASHALEPLGATIRRRAGVERLRAFRGKNQASVSIQGWQSEDELRASSGIRDTEQAAGDAEGHGPRGPIATHYVGMLATVQLLGEASSTLNAPAAARGLTEGISLANRNGPELLQCRDGWLIVQWRRGEERALLARLAASNANDLKSVSVHDAWRFAQEARLLAAPVAARSRLKAPTPTVLREPSCGPSRTRQLQVVDWSPLWAAPWATGQLGETGAHVTRIEVPSRRDGLLRSPHGQECWQRWNGRKELLLADCRTARGRAAVERALAEADLLVTGYTPRVLPNLGFDDAWFERFAPRLFRISSVAYDEPFSDLPGLGEQAAGLSGLLWGGVGQSPHPPLPWADPLLGVWLLLVIRAWERAGRPGGGHIRLSLEGAAALAVTKSSRPETPSRTSPTTGAV